MPTSSPLANRSAPIPAAELLICGCLAVFTQLATSRLFGTMVGGASYYSGLFLLAGMFTQGIGLGAPRFSAQARWFPALLALPLGAAAVLGRFNLIAQHGDEFQWTLVANLYPQPANFDLHLAILLLVGASLPLHLVTGALLGARQLSHDLGARGYMLSAGGAVSGALLFAGVIHFIPSLGSMAMVWIGLLFLGRRLGMSPRHGRSRTIALEAGAFLVLAGVTIWLSSEHLWSPYQRVDLRQSSKPGVDVLSNGMYISTVLTVPLRETPEDIRRIHRPPFSVVSPTSRVLIAGAGAGSADVREALGAGAASVDAVEIDPTFISLGRTFDPDQTYDDPRVQVHVQDARRFVAGSRDTFDLVYFPFLDSQTSASAHARFRLDSFLYTVEGLRAAWARTAPTGHLFVNFCTATPWIQRRIYDTLREATGIDVRVLHVPGSCWTLYVASKGETPRFSGDLYRDVTDVFRNSAAGRLATDDWPFLYNREAAIPMEHARLLATIAILFLAIAGWVRPEYRGGALATVPSRLLLYAAGSGAAFFFLEIRAISAMTPLLGANHLAQSAVIGAIVLSSLAGTWLAGRFPSISLTPLWSALAATLVIPMLWRPTALGTSPWDWGLQLIIMVIPGLIAGAIYMRMINALSSASVIAMQRANLIGGAIGGLGEVLVVLTGFSQSLAVAAILYTASGAPLMLGAFNHRRRGASASLG